MKRLALSVGFVVVLASASAHAETPVVHVDASSDVVLERVDGPRTLLCRAPCDQAVDPQGSYRLDGPDMRASNDFHVPDRATNVKIQVKPQSSSGFATGIVLTSLSGVFLAGGIAMLAGSFLDASLGSFGTDLLLFGGSMASFAASISLGIPGVILLVNHAQSRARVMEADLKSAQVSAPTPRAAAVSVPLFTKTF